MRTVVRNFEKYLKFHSCITANIVKSVKSRYHTNQSFMQGPITKPSIFAVIRSIKRHVIPLFQKYLPGRTSIWIQAGMAYDGTQV